MRGFVRRRWRWIVLAAYATVVIATMILHEPWFDEAQAWLIARDASYHDILLVRPHYEGHPPLWWLLLSVPAKLGAPYEIGLKSVQFLRALLMISLLVFRCPLPAPVVALLPFTYFLCYQYGVIARPYALMVAAMFLSTITWKGRDAHPWRFSLSLALLCSASSFGIALACGFALAWIWRAVRDDGIPRLLTKNPQRILSLSVLLAVGIVLTLLVVPRQNAIALHDTEIPLPQRAALAFLVLPSESLVTSLTPNTLLTTYSLPWQTIAICAPISLMIMAVLIHLARRRRSLPIFLLPAAMLSVCFVGYAATHHEGILFAFLLCTVWLNHEVEPITADDIPMPIRRWWRRRLSQVDGSKSASIMRSLRFAVVLLLLGPSLYWNAAAISCDWAYDYSGSRALAEFIRDNDLDHDRWISVWAHRSFDLPGTGSTIMTDDEDDTHYYVWDIVSATPFFRRTLLSCTYNGYSYMSNEVASQTQAEREIAACGKGREPEFFVGDSIAYFTRRLGYDNGDYRPYVLTTTLSPWKDQRSYSTVTVFIRNDIYERLFP